MSQVTCSSKRNRELGGGGDADCDEMNTKLYKVPNIARSKTFDFHCQVYFQEKICNFTLSDVFSSARFAVLFFCPYDFTNESEKDLSHIEGICSQFYECGAVPIAITHDRAQVHWGYASPGRTPRSLQFTPSFILASDSMDRLISASFKSIELDTLVMKRSVAVVDKDMNTIFQYFIPGQRYFPMTSILQCFQ